MLWVVQGSAWSSTTWEAIALIVDQPGLVRLTAASASTQVSLVSESNAPPSLGIG